MARPIKGILLITCGVLLIFPVVFNFVLRFLVVFIGIYLIILGVLAIVERDWD
ncbi:MAG: hypothetical protein WCT20_03740 [Candidatus Babeliales bacterium]